MLEPDKRYDIIKPMLNEGKIRRFLDIFHYQKKTVVARDLGKRGPRFDYLIHRVEKFTVEELLIIARLCHLSFDEMMQLVKTQLETRHSKIGSSPNDKTET